jgi:hypothetical protein
MRRTLIPFALLSITLFGCTREPAELAPNEMPQVSISSINGVNVRTTPSNRIFVPSSSIYDVQADITASDETAIASVELFVNDRSVGKTTPVNADGKPVDFKNPFRFSISTFTGTVNQATPAKLRAVAIDNTGQVSEYELNVLVDATPPVIRIDPIIGIPGLLADSFAGSIIVSGAAFDLESGVKFNTEEGQFEVLAYLDGDKDNLLNLSSDTDTRETAFLATIEGLEDGVHFVTVEIRNGANVFASQTLQFRMAASEEPVAP